MLVTFTKSGSTIKVYHYSLKNTRIQIQGNSYNGIILTCIQGGFFEQLERVNELKFMIWELHTTDSPSNWHPACRAQCYWSTYWWLPCLFWVTVIAIGCFKLMRTCHIMLVIIENKLKHAGGFYPSTIILLTSFLPLSLHKPNKCPPHNQIIYHALNHQDFHTCAFTQVYSFHLTLDNSERHKSTSPPLGSPLCTRCRVGGPLSVCL